MSGFVERVINPWLEKLSSWAGEKSDLGSPFLLRNLRQSVRSKIFLIVFALMLFMASMVAFMGYFQQSDTTRYQRVGQQYFAIFYVLLNVASFLAVPFFLGNSLRQEKLLKQDEQILITTLTPRRIIWGILSSGLAMIFLVYSALTPFLMYTYLLKGIDQVAIGISLIVTLALSLLMCCMTLALVGLAQEERTKLNALGLSLLVGVGVVSGISRLMISESQWISSKIYKPEFWGVTLFLITMYIGQFWLWFSLAVSGIMEEEGNKTTEVRWGVLIQFIILIGWALFIIFGKGTFHSGGFVYSFLMSISVDAIAIFCLILWAFGAFLFCTESDTLSRRQKEGFKKLPLYKRLLSPIMMPGASRGFLFLLIGLIGTSILLMNCRSSYIISSSFVAMGFILGYICLPAQLYRMAFPGRFKVKICRNIVLWGNVIWLIFSSFCSAAMYSYRNKENIFAATNPGIAISDAHRFELSWVVAGVLAVGTVLLYLTSTWKSWQENKDLLREK